MMRMLIALMILLTGNSHADDICPMTTTLMPERGDNYYTSPNDSFTNSRIIKYGSDKMFLTNKFTYPSWQYAKRNKSYQTNRHTVAANHKTAVVNELQYWKKDVDELGVVRYRINYSPKQFGEVGYLRIEGLLTTNDHESYLYIVMHHDEPNTPPVHFISGFGNTATMPGLFSTKNTVGVTLNGIALGMLRRAFFTRNQNLLEIPLRNTSSPNKHLILGDVKSRNAIDINKRLIETADLYLHLQKVKSGYYTLKSNMYRPDMIYGHYSALDIVL